MGHFTFWISLSMRLKTETEQLNFGLSLNLGLSDYLSCQQTTVQHVETRSSAVAETARWCACFASYHWIFRYVTQGHSK